MKVHEVMVDFGSDVTTSDGIYGCFFLGIQRVRCMKVELRWSILTIQLAEYTLRISKVSWCTRVILVHHNHGGTHYKCVLSSVMRKALYGFNIY